MSTQFKHKQIHKGTWRSPDYNIINQIDHVLVNQNKKEAIEDVRSLRGVPHSLQLDNGNVH